MPNRLSIPLCRLLLGLCAAGVLPARAQAPALRSGRSGRASMYSADRRFMVSGLSSSENMVLAGRLADLAAQVEKTTGMPLPMERGQVLGVMVQSSSSPDAGILKMQGWDGGGFYQRLVVPGRYRLDGEDLLEAAGWLLLNRYAAGYTPSAGRSGIGATIPEWMSAGLVQNTQAALHSRNRDWIVRELADGRHMTLSAIVRLESLPPGRWREKAYAAAAMEFLFPDGDLNAWAALFKAVGTRRAIDAAWLREHSAALAGPQHPETVWREHLAERARARTIAAWSDRGLQLEENLLRTLNIRPRTLVAGVPDDVPEELFAKDLMDYRGQEWTGPLAAALSLQVQSLRLGAPPLLQDVLASYAAYFDQLTRPPEAKTPWWRRRRRTPEDLRPPDDATWQVALNQLWLRAEHAHQRFLERHQTRKRYVDAFDRPEPGRLEETVPAADLPRTRWQRYVDEVEDRRGRQAF